VENANRLAVPHDHGRGQVHLARHGVFGGLVVVPPGVVADGAGPVRLAEGGDQLGLRLANDQLGELVEGGF
jgi:hypothetical protein